MQSSDFAAYVYAKTTAAALRAAALQALADGYKADNQRAANAHLDPPYQFAAFDGIAAEIRAEADRIENIAANIAALVKAAVPAPANPGAADAAKA